VKLLLDTHVWLWLEVAPERLSRATAERLADPGNELWLSTVRAWEHLLLAERKRIRVEHEPAAWLRRAFDGQRYRIAALELETVLAATGMRIQPRDPADRLLAATARQLGLSLVTADRRMLQGSGFEALPC